MIVRRSYRFEASHELPRHPGRCRRLHGHSYRVVVEVAGDPDEAQGVVIDFFDLDRIVEELVISKIDHRHANDLIENPTAEWLAVWAWRQLKPALPGLVGVEMFEVEDASAVYRGEYEEDRR